MSALCPHNIVRHISFVRCCADIYLQGYMSALYPSSVFTSGKRQNNWIFYAPNRGFWKAIHLFMTWRPSSWRPTTRLVGRLQRGQARRNEYYVSKWPTLFAWPQLWPLLSKVNYLSSIYLFIYVSVYQRERNLSARDEDKFCTAAFARHEEI